MRRAREQNLVERRNDFVAQGRAQPDFAPRYPHELSGGQRQRVVISRALAAGPELLVCDEPLAALGVSVEAQILELLEELRETMGLPLLFISHQLSTVRYLCDEVVVMYAGRIVERGTTADIYQTPRHPYAAMLLSTALDPRQRHERKDAVVGEAPNPINRLRAAPSIPAARGPTRRSAAATGRRCGCSKEDTWLPATSPEKGVVKALRCRAPTPRGCLAMPFNLLKIKAKIV